MADNESAAVIARLYNIILSRRNADPEKSYVAKLFAKGRHRMAKKLGEEGVEAALAAVDGSKEDLIGESADMLFHLLILWADAGIHPDQVYAKLAEREGVSGLSEKKSRKIL